jgi:hypothetical protein
MTSDYRVSEPHIARYPLLGRANRRNKELSTRLPQYSQEFLRLLVHAQPRRTGPRQETCRANPALQGYRRFRALIRRGTIKLKRPELDTVPSFGEPHTIVAWAVDFKHLATASFRQRR